MNRNHILFFFNWYMQAVVSNFYISIHNKDPVYICRVVRRRKLLISRIKNPVSPFDVGVNELVKSYWSANVSSLELWFWLSKFKDLKMDSNLKLLLTITEKVSSFWVDLLPLSSAANVMFDNGQRPITGIRFIPIHPNPSMRPALHNVSLPQRFAFNLLILLQALLEATAFVAEKSISWRSKSFWAITIITSMRLTSTAVRKH